MGAFLREGLWFVKGETENMVLHEIPGYQFFPSSSKIKFSEYSYAINKEVLFLSDTKLSF